VKAGIVAGLKTFRVSKASTRMSQRFSLSVYKH